jgi:hypothetical protein
MRLPKIDKRFNIVVMNINKYLFENLCCMEIVCSIVQFFFLKILKGFGESTMNEVLLNDAVTCRDVIHDNSILVQDSLKR